MIINKKYNGGFSVRGKTDFDTVEWLLDRNESNELKLQFLAYDANVYPLPDMSDWSDNEWRQKQIDIAKEFTKDFSGKVFLDSILI